MLSLIETRNRHFLEACMRINPMILSSDSANLSEVAVQAALSPAPHYYCTFDYALRVLRVLRHGRLKLRNDRRLAQWMEINGKVDKLIAAKGYSLIQALTHVLSFDHASQFFMTPASAVGLLYKLLRAGG